jgi:hypothetical protein
VKEIDVSLKDDSSISEINILPDGRVCVFGASQQVLEILDAIPLADPILQSRIECLRRANAEQIAAPNGVCPAPADATMKNPTSL